MYIRNERGRHRTSAQCRQFKAAAFALLSYLKRNCNGSYRVGLPLRSPYCLHKPNFPIASNFKLMLKRTAKLFSSFSLDYGPNRGIEGANNVAGLAQPLPPQHQCRRRVTSAKRSQKGVSRLYFVYTQHDMGSCSACFAQGEIISLTSNPG